MQSIFVIELIIAYALQSAKESCGGQYYEADFYTPQWTEDVKLIEKVRDYLNVYDVIYLLSHNIGFEFW